MNKKYKFNNDVFRIKKYKFKTNHLVIKGVNDVEIITKKIRIWKKIYKAGYRNFR